MELSLRFSRLGAGTLVLSLFALQGSALPSASAADSSSAILTSVSGSPASGITTSDVVVQKTSGPVSATGSVTEVLEQTLDTTKTQVRGVSSGGTTVPDVNYPSGWTLQYFNGTSWSGTAPAYDATSGTFPTLSGLKATGTFDSGGLSGGSQVVTRTAVGALEAGVNFSGSSGGDGWDVFFGGNRIFNIFHHNNSAVVIDCHERSGASCWASTFSMSGYSSAPRSTGFYDATNDRIYAFAVRHSDGLLGMTCAKDVSTATPSACATPFTAYVAAGGTGYEYVGDAVRIGDKIYMRGSGNNQKLLCFDIASAAKCTADGLMTDAIAGNGSWPDNRLLDVGSKVFISTGTKLACFDSVTNSMCSGFGVSGVIAATTLKSLFYTTNASGMATQVCAYSSGACWNVDTGTAGTWPSGFSATAGSIADGWGATTNIGTKLFYYAGNFSRCFDFATNAACAGFTGQEMGNYPYKTVQDPNNSLCLWSNSDNGAIKSFVLATGATPCSPQNTVVIGYADVVPLMGCAESDRVTSWTSLKVLSPASASVTSATVTVRNTAGSEIAGWQNLSVTLTTDATDATKKSGTLSLSGLPVNSGTLRPSFAITFPELVNATGGSGTFIVAQSPPALCSGVKPQSTVVACPTGVGSGSGDFPYGGSPITFSSTVTVTPGGGSSTTEASSGSASRVATLAATSCLTSLTGYVYRGGNATPVANATVSLLGPSGSTGLTATTAVDGSYTFTSVYPATYRAQAEGITSSSRAAPYISGGGTQLPDVVIPVPSSGGGSQPEAVTAEPVKVAPPRPLPLPQTPIAPIAPGTNSNLPMGGLPTGASVVLLNGEKVDAVVQPDTRPTARQPVGLIVTGSDFSMRLMGLGTDARPLGLTPDGALVLEADRQARVSGSGFQPNSDVNLYVFSEPRYIGTVRTDAQGSFDGTVPVPMDLAEGRHTLQSNGFTPDGRVRSLSLGVHVDNTEASTRPRSRVAGITLQFDALSSNLTARGERKIEKLLGSVGSRITAVTVTGYVQDSGDKGNEKSLSLKRARTIAKFLEARGITVKPKLYAAGVAEELSAAGRKALISVRFIPARG